VCIIDRGRILVLDTVDRIKANLGEGDVFEVELNQEAEQALGPVVERLRREGQHVTCQGKGLRFTSADGATVLADILQTAHARGASVERLGMRRKTLEDMFIRLTGRGLRE
jgi:ABC-2 type transport system ATP-binding protein